MNPEGQGPCYCCAVTCNTYYAPTGRDWWVWMCNRCVVVFVRTKVKS